LVHCQTTLTTNISGVKDGFAFTFNEKHHGASAMIGIEKSDPDPVSRGKLNVSWGIQRDWSLMVEKIRQWNLRTAWNN
jgi:hypothetical protein